MDYEQTYQVYKNLVQAKKFEEQPDFNQYKKQQGWFEKLKSPRTGEYYQADELVSKELV